MTSASFIKTLVLGTYWSLARMNWVTMRTGMNQQLRVECLLTGISPKLLTQMVTKSWHILLPGNLVIYGHRPHQMPQNPQNICLWPWIGFLGSFMDHLDTSAKWLGWGIPFKFYQVDDEPKSLFSLWWLGKEDIPEIRWCAEWGGVWSSQKFHPSWSSGRIALASWCLIS